MAKRILKCTKIMKCNKGIIVRISARATEQQSICSLDHWDTVHWDTVLN